MPLPGGRARSNRASHRLPRRLRGATTQRATPTSRPPLRSRGLATGLARHRKGRARALGAGDGGSGAGDPRHSGDDAASALRVAGDPVGRGRAWTGPAGLPRATLRSKDDLASGPADRSPGRHRRTGPSASVAACVRRPRNALCGPPSGTGNAGSRLDPDDRGIPRPTLPRRIGASARDRDVRSPALTVPLFKAPVGHTSRMI